MKAILINPFDQSIREVEYDAKDDDISVIINCRYFDVANLPNGDGIFVDDEGMLNNPTHFFKHEDYHSPLAGKGLILGCDDEGESIAPATTIEEVRRKVTFLNIYQVRAMVARSRA